MSNNSRQYFREDSFFDVPKDGDIIALKFICNDFSKYGANLSAENYSTEGSRFIRTSDIDEDGKLSVDGVYIDEDLALEYKLKKGDFLLSRSGTLGRGYLYSELDGNCSYAGYLIKYSLNELIVNPKFIFYCTKTSQFNGWLNYSVIEATIGNINGEKYANLPLPIPSLEQQNKIVNYLDREIAKIDALIENKTKLIALLEEKKKAVINQAVTKGLDTTVAMKDSGIEWLGEIPEHWHITKMKYVLSSLNNIRIPLSAEVRGLMVERTYDYYGASGIIDKVEDYLFEEPLLLIGEDGANLVTRSSRLVFIARGKYWVNNHAHILKPIYGVLEYYCELLEIYDYTLWVSGSAQPKLTSEALLNIPIIVPPDREQKLIADFLNKVSFEHNKLSNKILTSIELLKEKRTTIISAAINGEIEL
ncbi:hypothetical protein BWK60_07410 [Flavobacterium covae]|uniref:restriction endonuclease subunit S n=1 Tax=Flavobacterium covae TaxID=2906076 RepID=UPI000B4CCF17|nr:restriction endonuclease subunit S [Flavobacterium covae]OWP86717.1 hypothetical protein BWK60_07410 [Flavobacterium covae]